MREPDQIVVLKNMEGLTKPYLFMQTDHYFYFRTQGETFPKKLCISINRLTSKVEQITLQQFEASTYQISTKNSESIYLIIGIISIMQQPYICLANKCESVATYMNDQVYIIKDVKFVPFKHRFLYASIDQSQCEKILDGIRTDIIMDNFYFCYHQDLTLTHDKQMTKSKRPTERKYFWNQDQLKMFARHKLPLTWRIPVMQGHISEIKTKNSFFSYSYLNISRRSKHMSGTRFNSRGLDHSFNSANFVETEQIFLCHNYVFSHVSLRGSVPLFWDQIGFGADIRFSKATDEQNQLVFQKHFELLNQQYNGEIVAINLLSKTKSPQKQLKNRYQFFCKKTKRLYLYFDLNQEAAKQNGQKGIENFINFNMELLVGQGNYFCFDSAEKKILSRQKLLPRINCLDCIDRTNVLMARISELYLKQVETFINTTSKDPHMKLELGKQFDSKLLHTWTKLGNKISMVYCGTQSVASHLTKKQNNSFFSFFSGSMKSINRYYNANVNDSAKQDCLDYFLCNKEQRSSSMQYFQDNITSQILKNQQLKYCQHQQFGVYIVTWNCNMLDPSNMKPKDFDKLLNFSRDDVDLIVISLQEMVELNSYNVILGNNQTIVQSWKQMLFNHLNQQNDPIDESTTAKKKKKRGEPKKYEYLTGYDLVGISAFVFANQKVIDKINNLEWLQIKTGFKGSLGNKGTIILFMNIDSTPITFLTCHLAAGQSKAAFRIQDIDYIHRQAIKDRVKRRFFDMSEFRFFIGDFNFRLEAKSESVLELLYQIQKQDYNQKLTKQQLGRMLSPLLEKDQFRLNCHHGQLSSYMEPEIYFLPTYKYVKKQKGYDVKRTPSWCDRILLHRKDKLKITTIKYTDIDIYQSDHKPVLGLYRFLCKKQDADNKKKLIQMYYDS